MEIIRNRYWLILDIGIFGVERFYGIEGGNKVEILWK